MNDERPTPPLDEHTEVSEDQESFWRWVARPQALIALSAVVLSVCGLTVSLYEASLIRRHHRASVWPHVAVTASMTSEGARLFVQNTGVGPARIDRAAATVDGTVMEDWEEVVLSVLDEPMQVSAYQSFINGHVLPPSSVQKKIFEITSEGTDTTSVPVSALQRNIENGSLDIEICYCSVYDECWTSSMQDVMGPPQGTRAATHAAIARRVDDCSDMPVSGI